MSYDSGVVICDSKFSTPSYVSIEDITIYDADELYSYCVDAGMFEDNELLESAISWIPQDDIIEWYTLNVFTEHNDGLDLTRLGANYLMMIHYSK